MKSLHYEHGFFGRSAYYIILVVFAIVMGFPILWMVFNSLKTHGEIFTNIWGPPTTPQWANYPRAWKTASVGILFRNSLIVTVCSVSFITILTAFASFGIAKIRFKGSRMLFTLFIVTMLVPQQILVIPLYRMVKMFGLINTLFSLILPYIAGGLPLAIFIFTTYLRGIPDELIEAARIDGCRDIRILWQIIAPISWPAISAVVIFEFLEAWNEFFLALVFLNRAEIRTLPLGVFAFMGRFMIDYSLFFSVLSISIMPVVVVFLIFQRQFVRGLTAGALVG